MQHINPAHAHLNVHFVSLLNLQLLQHFNRRLVCHRFFYNIQIDTTARTLAWLQVREVGVLQGIRKLFPNSGEHVLLDLACLKYNQLFKVFCLLSNRVHLGALFEDKPIVVVLLRKLILAKALKNGDALFVGLVVEDLVESFENHLHFLLLSVVFGKLVFELTDRRNALFIQIFEVFIHGVLLEHVVDLPALCDW